MAEQAELIQEATLLNHEAGELETSALVQGGLGADWQNVSDEIFNKLADAQTQADGWLNLAYASGQQAKKKRKEALKLERQARRLSRGDARHRQH